MKASIKKKKVSLPRAGTMMRETADLLLSRRSRVWYVPSSASFARCAQTLRDKYNWPIEDQVVDGAKYHKYRLDPERRSHYEFI